MSNRKRHRDLAVAVTILMTQVAQGQVKSFLQSCNQSTTIDAEDESAFFLSDGHAIKTYRTSLVGTSECLNTWSSLLVRIKENHTYLERSRKDVLLPSSVESITDYEAMSIALRLDQASVTVHDKFVVKGDTMTLVLKMKREGNSVIILNQ